MAAVGASVSRAQEREGLCPYCGTSMGEGECRKCGRICPRCGTPSRELVCPQCGHGSSPTGAFASTGSPAPAQSPEFSDVQQILGRPPSRREFNMVRGMIDRDRERIHRLTEQICDRFPAPLNRQLIEARAIQVWSRARKSESGLSHAESVIFSLMESAKQSGMLESVTRALAEAQLLDANLRLGLSRARLPPLKFVTEVSGAVGGEPVILFEGVSKNCKRVLMETRDHSRTYLMLWRPLLSDYLEDSDGSPVKRITAAIQGTNGFVPLMIAWGDKPAEKSWSIEVLLDPKRFFFGFTTRKGVQVDVGLPAFYSTHSDAEVALRRITKQLDNLQTTSFLFKLAGAPSPSAALWSDARSVLVSPRNSQVAVTPRRKAAAALLAADMKQFAELEPTAMTRVALAVRKIPMSSKDAAYACNTGLIVPSEFSAPAGVEWADALSLAVKF